MRTITGKELDKAILSLSGDVDDTVLKQVVEDHDFTVVGIE